MNNPCIMDEERKCYPLCRLNSLSHRLLVLLTTPLARYPMATSVFEPILVVSLPESAEAFKSVIDQMTYGTDYQLVNMLDTENVNIRNEDLHTSIDELQNQWNIYLV